MRKIAIAARPSEKMVGFRPEMEGAHMKHCINASTMLYKAKESVWTCLLNLRIKKKGCIFKFVLLGDHLVITAASSSITR